MMRNGSTSPHSSKQPHQRDRALAKRAAAKVVRKKINESLSQSKATPQKQEASSPAMPGNLQNPARESKKPVASPAIRKKAQEEEKVPTVASGAYGVTRYGQGSYVAPADRSREQSEGSKKLNKKMEMRMDSGKVPHAQQNRTRSLIEDPSEDFTNIEEHIEEDTRISCRNMVDSVSKPFCQ